MTLIETSFLYCSRLTESTLRALDHVADVYGIRRIGFDEKRQIITVEYDKSRLSEDDVIALLRDAAIVLCGHPEGVQT